jgi:hypothetical protein
MGEPRVSEPLAIGSDEPHWAKDWSQIVAPEGWRYVEDVSHDRGDCAVYRHEATGRTVHVELPD